MRLPRTLAVGIEALLEGRDLKAIRRASEEITESYRSGRPQIALRTSEHRLAYLLVRLPATYAAVFAVLQEVKERLGEIHSVLDLGAGPGTAVWAAAETFPELERVTLIEREEGMVALGYKLAASHSAFARAHWIVDDFRSARFEDHDLVIAPYSLGELPGKDRLAVSMKGWAAAQKAFAVIEPGTPRGFASLLPLREALLAQGQRIAAPCPADAECPMKTRSGDWCHFSARLERTALHRRLKSGELGYEDEKFSYLVFAKDKAAPQAAARILRHPVHGKGHIKLTLCEAPQVREVTVGKSEGQAFRLARRARWGDVWPQTNADKR